MSDFINFIIGKINTIKSGDLIEFCVYKDHKNITIDLFEKQCIDNNLKLEFTEKNKLELNVKIH